jgi:TRAP-type C4-dicarboxylate transport system permease small subunit
MAVRDWALVVERGVHKAALWASIGSGLSLFIMMIVTVIDVIARYAGRPLLGFFEITSLLLVSLVFFAVAQTQAIKGNVNVEVLYSHLPKRLQGLIGCITHLFCLGLSVLMGWRSWLQSQDILEKGQVTGTLFIPMFPFYLIVVFGFALLSLVFLFDAIHSAGKVVKP